MNTVWKQFERQVAKFFGAKRNPLSGRNSKHSASDSLHQFLFIECKYRKNMVYKAEIEKAKDLAKKEGKIPVLCVKEKGLRGFYIITHSTDFKEVALEHINRE